MILQTFKTKCVECGEVVKSKLLDTTGDNEIDIDMTIEGLGFECECGTITIIEAIKYQE